MTDVTAAARPDSSEATLVRNRAIDRFLRHRLAVGGIITVAVLVLMSFAGPYLLPFDDLFIDIRHRFAPPFVSVHIFGTDPLGRDLLARLMMAGRISMSIGFAAMLIATCLGTVIGAVA
jgi:peptide/nickel transport system permease protein